jgi:hypothetical protein
VSLALSAHAAPRFTDVTTEFGLAFPTQPSSYTAFQMPDVMASGAAFLDYDGDGDADVYLLNQTWRFGDEAAAPRGRLFRHDPGERFVDVTTSSGLVHDGYPVGIAVGDIDNDGDPDVFLSNYHGDALFRNEGDGHFRDVTAAAGVVGDAWSCSAAFFDYDRDGFLDLWVTQYVVFDSTRQCTDPTGRPDFCGPKDFTPLPDVLLHNRGDGTFEDVSEAAGLLASAGAGLGVVCEDFNEDGLIDVYVANDAYANNLWMNQGDGTFYDEALMMGAAFNEQGVAEAGMGVVAADFDRDGDFDLFMTHLLNETHTLYMNLGGGIGFEDATTRAGMGSASMEYTGFGTIAFDVELDGDLDLFVANGAVGRGKTYPGVQLGEPWRNYGEPNQLFQNDGAGRFTPMGTDAGPIITDVEITRGSAAADLDGDGDLDLLVTNCHSTARLYRTDTPPAGHWLSVRAIDPRLRRDAIGAVVAVRYGESRALRPITSAVGYQSSTLPIAHFGLGGADRYDAIDVRWPDGRLETFPGGAADRAVELRRGEGEVRP